MSINPTQTDNNTSQRKFTVNVEGHDQVIVASTTEQAHLTAINEFYLKHKRVPASVLILNQLEN